MVNLKAQQTQSKSITIFVLFIGSRAKLDTCPAVQAHGRYPAGRKSPRAESP